MRMSYALVLLPGLVGAVLGAIAYFVPITGVDGTPGALLALVGALAVTIGGLLAMVPSVAGRTLRVLNVLLGLGAILTTAAAYFLMQYAFALVMALTGLGLLLAIMVRSNWRSA